MTSFTAQSIGTLYAEMLLARGIGDGVATARHVGYGFDILNKDAHAMIDMFVGGNETARTVFTLVTKVPLPKGEAAMIVAVRAWAGLSDQLYAVHLADRKVGIEVGILNRNINGDVSPAIRQLREIIAGGYNVVEKTHTSRWFLTNKSLGRSYDLSKRGSLFVKMRDLINAEIALIAAKAELAKSAPAPVATLAELELLAA